MKKLHQILKTKKAAFAAAGFGLGLFLVIIATGVETGSFLGAQISSPYLWLMDTVPFVLAYCGLIMASEGSESDAGKQLSTLYLLIFALGLIPFCMVVNGAKLNRESEGYLQGIHSAQSIRFRSLWLRNPSQARFGIAVMRSDADFIFRDYSGESVELKIAWDDFENALAVNSFEHQKALNLGGAANRLSEKMEARRQETMQHVASNFRLGMAGLLLTLAMGIALVRRLSLAEKRVYEQGLQLTERQALLEFVNRRLGRLANHDSLTGLHNHRAFQERLREEYERASRYTSSLSLVMVDVDKFKQLNDKLGHVAGDEVLKGVADVLKESCRSVDFVARYGGEEFVVLMPNAHRLEATAAAERLRAAVATSSKATVSIGVATFDMNGIEPPELLTRADLAMYESKRKGRNRITHFEDMPIPSMAVIGG